MTIIITRKTWRIIKRRSGNNNTVQMAGIIFRYRNYPHHRRHGYRRRWPVLDLILNKKQRNSPMTRRWWWWNNKEKGATTTRIPVPRKRITRQVLSSVPRWKDTIQPLANQLHPTTPPRNRIDPSSRFLNTVWRKITIITGKGFLFLFFSSFCPVVILA